MGAIAAHQEFSSRYPAHPRSLDQRGFSIAETIAAALQHSFVLTVNWSETQAASAKRTKVIALS